MGHRMKRSYGNPMVGVTFCSDALFGSVPKMRAFEGGFSLFEALIAALIAAVAVAGVMQLHNRNIQHTAGNAELQRAQMILANAQQRYLHSQTVDTERLNAQAQQSGLNQHTIQMVGNAIVLSWQAWSPDAVVMRGCTPMIVGSNSSCIAVTVR